jgi:CheY-like chemotaxis protein
MTDFNSMNGLEVLIHLLTNPQDGFFLWVLIGFGIAMIAISVYLDKQDEEVVTQPPEHHL